MAQLTELGEIVTWESPPHIAFQKLKDSMQLAGIDPDMAKELLPRYAFSRAVKELDENRVIKQAKQDDYHLWFQFTREYFDKNQSEFKYSFETMLRLNKSTGAVDCADAQLAQHAHSLVLQHLSQRTSSDVTRIVQRLFEKMSSYGDLFPIRKQGGAYFVPAHYKHLVDQIDNMMTSIGGKMGRWQISPTDQRTKQSAGEAISDAVSGLIEDYNAAIDEFDPNKGTAEAQEKMVRRVLEIQGMVTAYKDYLQNLSVVLEQQLDESAKHLQDKIAGKTPPKRAESKDKALVNQLRAALGAL